MPRADFFARFGFLHARGFFDTETCDRLRAQIRAASGEPATVRGRNVSVVDERVRKVTWTHVSPPTRTLVEERLARLKPDLERHFGMTLSSYEDPSLLRYRPGDFYVPHRDRGDDPEVDRKSGARLVSVVVFLSGEGDASDPEAYRGGALTFAGLLDDPRLRLVGIPLVAEPGLLVAFRSGVVHGVTPVTHGERYTIVTWFS